MFNVPLKHRLTGKSILLRSIEASDYPGLKSLLNDKVTMQSLIPFFGTEEWSDQKVIERYKKFQEEQTAGRGLQYVVVDLKTHEIKGNCGFKNIDSVSGEAEYGIILHQSVWGSGVCKECFFLNFSYGFEEMSFKKIYFRTHIENHRMIGFFKKIGISQPISDSQSILRFEINQRDWPQTKILLRA